MIKGKMILTGQSILAVNKQGQFSLPTDLVSALQNHAYLTQGFDHNLLLMSSESFERTYLLIKNTSISDPLARLLTRLFLGSASELIIDASGTIQIPENLREYVGTSKQIVIVGQGDYFELWSPTAWDEQAKSLRDYQANIDRFTKFNLASV